jgi:hypothetical protein
VAEPLEQRNLLVAEAAGRVIRRQVADERPDAGADLEGEVRRGGADERLDVLDRRLVILGHRGGSYPGLCSLPCATGSLSTSSCWSRCSSGASTSP